MFPVNNIWVTRGKHWGFCFLRKTTTGDPWLVYEVAFENVPIDAQKHHEMKRIAIDSTREDVVALRFLDPLARSDASGRIISHDFVLFGEFANQVNSVEQGLEKIWPLIETEYAEIFELPTVPQEYTAGR
jgi:hypothetical protein